MFDIVVAADREWGIGKSNGMPWPKLRGDLAHFKRVTCATTEGKRSVVAMGRKTWESTEVAGRPLPKRLNVVVTRNSALVVPDGVVVAPSLDVALADAAASPDVEATFVIGGSKVYCEALLHADLRWIYLTRVDGSFGCDVTIPDLDRDFVHDPWDGEKSLEDSDVRYHIVRLRRK